MRKLKIEDLKVSNWGGGSTTELAICPANARFKDKDFLWRMSHATVDLDESDFTALSSYTRLIATNKGTMRLVHGDGSCAEIIPRTTVYSFDGASPTHCFGRAGDLNLMLRKGKATGELRFLAAGEHLDLELSADETALVYALDTGDSWISEGGSRLTLTPDCACALFIARVLP